MGTSVTPSKLIDTVSSHAEMLICSEVHLTDVSSRQLSWKRGGSVQMAQASKVSLAPGGSSWTPGALSGGLLGRQETRLEVVWAARKPRPFGASVVRRPSGPPARPEAVWAARGPECRFFHSFSAKCRFCAGYRQGAGCRQEAPPAKLPTRKAAIAEF